MNYRNLIIFFFLVLIFSLSCGKQRIIKKAEKGFLDLKDYNFKESGVIQIDGEWEFYWNKLLTPNDFRDSILKTQTYLNVPNTWNKLIIDNKKIKSQGFATYHLKIALKDSSLINFKLYRVESAYKMWVNGDLILEVGQVSENKLNAVPTRRTEIASYQNKTDKLDIIIQVSNFHHKKSGIINSIKIAPPEILAKSDKESVIYNAFLIGFLLIISFSNFGLFLLRRKDIVPLFFSFACLFTTLNLIVNGEVFLTFVFPNLNWELILKYDYWTNYLKVLFFYLFVTYSFKEISNKTITKIIVYTLLISILIVTFTNSLFYTKTLFIFYIVIIFAFLHLIYILTKATKFKLSGAIYSFIGTLVVFVTAINDILFDALLINTMYLTPFGLFVFVFFQSYMISYRFSESLKNSEKLTSELKYVNENLEELVETRTQEIKQQKEEIETQSEILLKVNTELEKLSIVASKTDNSIVIMDENGNLEWFNEGSRKLFGYTFEEVIEFKGRNIIEINKNVDIISIVTECKSAKKSIIFENQSFTKYGNIIWLQTTLTPILDDNNEVKKLVAIDSDITKLKEAEDKILKQNYQLESQNNNITASIRYAETIQKNILPKESLCNEFIDKFIIFRPKDVVSGDFYMLNYINSTDLTKYPDRIYAAVVDCTGHGVPGAFMSLITSRLILEILYNQTYIYPAEILTKLAGSVLIALNQEQTDNSDGFDICLCLLEVTENKLINKLIFSGAKRPLFKFNGESNQIEVYQGDKISIGGIHNHHPASFFTNQTIDIQKDDIIYLTSDGYIDQADENRKKLGTPKLVSTLKNIALQNMQTQKQILEKILEEHQSSQLQRDDITIFGLKFKV